ncbi:M15 family metallopeptidase [Paenibacillus sanguinis]|uniref:M15 family metallopeptidase n=1 Tax=Paenibacillus sanguinis TaxID=225906 RepID=UPI0003630A22|nr:M15 family metallopeptidase [Paenibacillus sanguinis]
MTLTLDYVKAKSTPKLSGLYPIVRQATERLIERSYAAGVPILITQGLRTIAEQDALYAQGRTKPGKIVTNARGGYSNHNFGMAIDFCLLKPDGKNVSWEVSPAWLQVVEIAKSLGFEWGGDWKKFKDYPHFEMTFGLTTAQYRAGKRPTSTQIQSVLKRMGEDAKKMDKAKVIVNGKDIDEGVLINGTAYVPLRAIGEALGLQVDWDNKSKTATISR